MKNMIEIIDQVVNKSILKKSVERFHKRGIILPTFAQLRNPDLIPGQIKDKLKHIGLWDLNPLNLFRITWKNEPFEMGGLYGGVNFIEFPSELTGVKARIIMLLGKFFPTGSHKVGAAYGCLAPRIITGQFDPTYHKAVWPSTGNYCRGGAFDSYLMGCTAVAILPEEMSKERFKWLADIGAEVIATPGCESNVKEIYDKCWEIRRTRPDCMIFNQFDEFGNPAWHYNTTGPAILEVFNKVKEESSGLAAYVSATGSAGTIAAGDFLRNHFPLLKVVAVEALQCPTLLYNGYGGHRIEGIGDKHVPWVHNVKNTNMVTAIDDEYCLRLFRLFNEIKGKEYLTFCGLETAMVNQLDLLGISSICNLLAAIRTAKYYEMTSEDIIFSIATDSADMYQSRLMEMRNIRGEYDSLQAAKDMERCLKGISVEHTRELSYFHQKTLHNLKYFTWREQQEKEVVDLDTLWYDRNIWSQIFNQPNQWDQLINEFNERTAKI